MKQLLLKIIFILLVTAHYASAQLSPTILLEPKAGGPNFITWLYTITANSAMQGGYVFSFYINSNYTIDGLNINTPTQTDVAAVAVRGPNGRVTINGTVILNLAVNEKLTISFRGVGGQDSPFGPEITLNTPPSSLLWKLSGNSLSPTVSSNLVGIGTDAPSSKLHVKGDALQISGGSAPDALKDGLTMGENTGAYTWIQSKSSLPLALNPVAGSGYVSIGYIPSKTLPNVKLAVNGKILCDELKIKSVGTWPDYVFDSTYALRSLQETEQYIQQHHHLPDVPSAEQTAKEGYEMGAMNALLLKKIEELTLHMIRHDKDIARLKDDNATLKSTLRK